VNHLRRDYEHDHGDIPGEPFEFSKSIVAASLVEAGRLAAGGTSV
jgi:hypothetical protein